MSDTPPSTDLTERSLVNPLQLARDAYTEKDREDIASFVGVPADHPAFMPFLGIATMLGLSPLLGEIWLIEERVFNEASQDWETVYRTAVGRDGFLKHAEEQPTFKGLRSNTVCANDTFEVEDDGYEVKIVHRFKSLGADADPKDASRYRGPVVGAWALLHFNDGRPPMFYYAPLHEHVQTTVRDGKRELAGAWSYESAMSQKSAQSYVLRIGYRITGVVPVDEIRGDGDSAARAESRDGKDAIANDPMIGNNRLLDGLEIDDDLRRLLSEALQAINDLSPFSWSPSKLNLRLGERTDEDVRKVLAEVEDEFAKLRDREGAEITTDIVDEAVQVALARDVKAPVELHLGGVGKDEKWVLIESVEFREKKGEMVFTYDKGKIKKTFRPTDQVEIRVPAEDKEPPPEPAVGDDPSGQ